jgi:hypothetical protein
MSLTDDKVGYRRPPVATRFKKGVSGNPSGKRKPLPTLSQRLDRILAEKMRVTDGGTAKRMDKEEVFLRQMVARGIAGDRQFGRLLLEYLLRRQATTPAAGTSATDEFLMTELLTMLTEEGPK